MAKISVAKNDVKSLAPQQIQDLPYPQHIINNLLLIQQNEEPRYVIQHDVNEACIHVPTNYNPVPDSNESLYTIAEFDFPQDDSSSVIHDTYSEISFPKDHNPYSDLPSQVSVQDITDESMGEDDTSQKVSGTSEAIRSQMAALIAQEILTPVSYEIIREVVSDATSPTESSDSASQ